MTSGPLLIIGDVLLDVDIEGSATRLSPEAPVPVVDAEQVWHRPGGAGLAALLAGRHEDNVVLVAGFADDEAGRIVWDLLQDNGVGLVGLPVTGSTVTKTRIRAQGQSLLRLDRGGGAPIPGPLPDGISALLASAQAICVADYGLGTTSLPTLRQALTAVAATVPIVWDPHPRGSRPVPGCRLVCPNESEAQKFCSDPACSDSDIRTLADQWDVDAICVTRGSRGAELVTRDGSSCRIPVPHSAAIGAIPADVCGAGDRFTVAAGVALAQGATAKAAVAAAVEAAARFVATGGAHSVATPAGRAPAVGYAGSEFSTEKLTMPGNATVDMPALAARLRSTGRRVVATGGCFDLLHPGHVRLLHEARQLGDTLVVLINSDASIRRIKGARRPIVGARDRARVLSALACVDAVAVFDEPTPERVLELLRPDVWVKGGDYVADELPEAPVVRRHGGEVVILPTVAGYSTSNLIAAARSTEGR
jgi:rfaE bifunctional protein nucleotidyltransferase chain/domain/rfaE bifunctional protein kinase chain/domain